MKNHNKTLSSKTWGGTKTVIFLPLKVMHTLSTDYSSLCLIFAALDYLFFLHAFKNVLLLFPGSLREIRLGGFGLLDLLELAILGWFLTYKNSCMYVSRLESLSSLSSCISTYNCVPCVH